MSLHNFIKALACPGKSLEGATVKLRRTIGRRVFLGRKMVVWGDFMQFMPLYTKSQLACMKFYILFIFMMNIGREMAKIMILIYTTSHRIIAQGGVSHKAAS